MANKLKSGGPKLSATTSVASPKAKENISFVSRMLTPSERAFLRQDLKSTIEIARRNRLAAAILSPLAHSTSANFVQAVDNSLLSGPSFRSKTGKAARWRRSASSSWPAPCKRWPRLLCNIAVIALAAPRAFCSIASARRKRRSAERSSFRLRNASARSFRIEANLGWSLPEAASSAASALR